MRLGCFLLAGAAALAVTCPASAESIRADQAAFREIFSELVNTDTSHSSGSCTIAAQQLAEHMWSAGFSRQEVRVIIAPGHEREGNLVAELGRSSDDLEPMLLMGHLDVVEARREDWTRDPFTLVEEDGYYFGRGVADDKARSAIWVDSLIRYRQEGYVPQRTIKLALTCGEEGNGEIFNGAEWLARTMPETLSAAFALNEGGGGRLGPDGNPQALALQVGEKATRTFDLEAVNPGGHSSVPRPDNAIYDLADAVIAIRGLQFPVQLNPTTRAFLRLYGPALPVEAQRAIAALLDDETDAVPSQTLSADPTISAMLRTTCVATMLDAGHAANALPQRARATVNCRILPGVTTEEVLAAIERAIDNPRVSIRLRGSQRPLAVPAPLDPTILQPATELAEEMFPGIPVIPIMLTGATDATMTGIIGIPTYGVPGLFFDADGGGAHGLNERIKVRSVYDGRDYLHRLIRLYADGPVRTHASPRPSG